MSRDLIDKYESGPEPLALAIRGLTEDDLRWVPPADAPPEVGRWSIQQVVIHLADADVVFAHRVKRIVAEDEPVLQAWSEGRFVERLHYHEQSAADAVAIVEATHRQLTRVLRTLGDADFERAGRHNERGRQTLADVLGYAVAHIDHHVRFIHAKRARMGKEMW